MNELRGRAIEVSASRSQHLKSQETRSIGSSLFVLSSFFFLLYVLTVCTGTALLAKSELLDNKQVTTNKRAFSWVITNGPEVEWDKEARWKVDGN